MSDKASYRIILLLVVGLAAFSSAMKDLNQIQQLSLDASRLIAQWSATIAPTEVPQPAPVMAKVESCQMKQSAPSVELPWLTHVAETEENPAPVVAKRFSSNKVKKARPIDVDPVQLQVRIPSVNDDADADETIVSDFPVTSFAVTPLSPAVLKAKARKHGSFRFSPRDREILLKTFNRSINLRIAG